MANQFEIQQKLKLLQKQAAKERSFYRHAMAYAGINALLLVYWAIDTFIASIFWPRCFGITAGLSGVILLGHGGAVFGSKLLFGKNWEEEKLKQIIEKDKPTKNK